MRINKPGVPLLEQCFSYLDARASRSRKPEFVKYIDLGTHVVKLINYSASFTPHVEKQLTWSLKNDSPHYDATFVIWQDKDISEVALGLLGLHNRAEYHKLRVQRLARANPEIPRMLFHDEDVLLYSSLIDANPGDRAVSAWNPQTNTYYYAVEDLNPEAFIKRGHIFVHTFYKIVKTPSSNLVHGAVVGLQDKGVLFCAIGYRGKSTLTVNALLDGFDYVSDDYLVLGKKDDILRAWPIYSIIALSPGMYQKMYSKLQVKFVSNNGRKDKYIFNIEKYHDRFAPAYPVKLCMFPNITDHAKPSIVLGDKERAFEELASSSLRNTGNIQDPMTIGKLYTFVESLPFYRFNLSPDIEKNTQCLRKFLERF